MTLVKVIIHYVNNIDFIYIFFNKEGLRKSGILELRREYFFTEGLVVDKGMLSYAEVLKLRRALFNLFIFDYYTVRGYIARPCTSGGKRSALPWKCL